MTTFEPQIIILTVVHTLIALVGIVAGFVAVFGWIARQSKPSWTQTFLWTTIATSVTGFFFPITRLTPGLILGVLSLIVLSVTLYAQYAKRFAGPWQRTYAITALVALYFNTFVLIVQLFQKIPPLHAAAPTQAEPPFAITQGILLVIFLALGTIATLRFRPATLPASAPVIIPSTTPAA